jgi:hypothetical protein
LLSSLILTWFFWGLFSFVLSSTSFGDALESFSWSILSHEEIYWLFYSIRNDTTSLVMEYIGVSVDFYIASGNST